MWFKDHVYLASWISAGLAVVALLVNLRKSSLRGTPIDSTRAILMFLCLSSFPAALTPVFDSTARTFAQIVFSFTLVAMLVRRRE
jgi:hypothetical protein